MRNVGALLDRDHEVATLSAAAADVLEGEGATLVIEGLPGIGKTSLLELVAERAREDGWQVLRGRGSSLEGEFAFGVVRQLAADAPEGNPPPRMESSSEFEHFHELYWWLVGMTDDRPTAICVDDAQWADPSSMRFLEFLARRLDRLRLLLVLATRPRLPTESTGDSVSWGSATVLRPNRLSRSAIGHLVRDRMAETAEDEFVNACVDATGGNPLFLNELLRALVSLGVMPTAAETSRVADVGIDALRTRIGSLLGDSSQATRVVAEAVAILGPGAATSTVSRLSGLDEHQTDTAIDALTAAEVLEVGTGLTFRHPLIAAAVYQGIPSGTRQRLHQRAGEVLTAQGESFERIAGHVFRLSPAGDRQRVAVLQGAAMEARRRGVPQAAGRYLARAVAERPTDPSRAELLRQWANCEAYARDWESAERHLREAMDLSRDRGEQRALIAFSLSRLLEVTQRPGPGAELLAETLKGIDLAAAPETLVRLEAELAGYLLVVGRHDDWQAATARLDLLPAGLWAPLSYVRAAHHAYAAMIAGEPAETVARLARSALASDLLAPDLSALYVATIALAVAGHLDETSHHLMRATNLARSRGLDAAESLCRAYLGTAAYWHGELSLAHAELDLGWERAAGEDHAVPALLGCELELAVEEGRLDHAAGVLNRYSTAWPTHNSTMGVRALFGRGRYRLAAGLTAAGLNDFTEVGRIYGAWHSVSMLDLPWRSYSARALLELGSWNEAAALCATELELARHFGSPRPLAIALQTAADVHPDRARDLLLEAVEVLEPEPFRLELARTHAALGMVDVQGGNRTRGREQLRVALDEAASCAAYALRDETSRVLASLGGRPLTPQVSGVDALSPAERRVASLVVQQLSNREVARRLYVTEKTVEYHLTSVLKKVGAASRRELSAQLPELASTGDGW